MTAIVLAATALLLAMAPAILFFRNLALFHRLPPQSAAAKVSVLIPARNEEKHIAAAVKSVLAGATVDLEVIVVDDHSDDATAKIVVDLAHADPRLRLVAAPPLPAGWSGKQHACWVAAQHSRHELLVWIDADVVLSPDCLGRIAAEMSGNSAGLISGFPRQIAASAAEKLLMPLIHFILLGFLPIGLMRRDGRPSLGAGCGQLFAARRDEYFRCGGHAAIRKSFHDGLALPRLFRRNGIMTDLFDAADTARCRMYNGAGQTWRGLLKNAGEGMASYRAILPWTLVLGGGQVLPLVLLLSEPRRVWVAALSAAALAVSLAARLACAGKFHQSYLSAIFHPLGIAALLCIQWQSLLLQWLRRPVPWRGRVRPPV